MSIIREEMFFDAIVGLTVFKSGLDDGFLLSNFGMLFGIILDVATAKQIHIVEETAVLLSQDSRNVCLTIAADLNDLLQTKVRIQIEPLLYQCFLYAVDYLLTSLFGNILGLPVNLYKRFVYSRFWRSIRPLYGGRIGRLGGGTFCFLQLKQSVPRPLPCRPHGCPRSSAAEDCLFALSAIWI